MQEVEKLLKKLEPQLGGRADEIYRVYLLEDSRGRNEIHQYLMTLYNQSLSTPLDDKVVLVPPPGDLAGGEMPIATVRYADRDLYEFSLRRGELPMHCLVVGDTGSGKTNSIYALISNLMLQRIPFLIFDWKREFRRILNSESCSDVLVFTAGGEASPFYFNPRIAPKGVDPEVYLKKEVDNIAYAYFLGEGVGELLREVLHETNEDYGVYSGDLKEYPNYFDVLQKLEGRKPKGRELLWYQSTQRALRALTFGKFGKAINIRQDVDVESLLERNVIIELDGLNKADGKYIMTSLLSRIYFYRLAHAHENKGLHAIIIDEAHHLFLRKPSYAQGEEHITDILLREARSLGECLVLSDQYPHMLTYTAFGVYTKIVMSLGNRTDINLAADILLLGKDEREWLAKLPIGSAIVKLKARYPSPFLVHFPLMKLPEEPVTDDIVRERMKGYWEEQKVIPVIPGQQEGYSGPVKPEGVVPKGDKGGAERAEYLLLLDVLRFPLSSTVKRYERLGFSKRAGNDARGTLEEQGLVRAVDVPTKKARVRLLELTDRGRELLKSRGEDISNSMRFGSVEHLYWVAILAKESRITIFCEGRGFELEVEHAIGGGKTVDLAAVKGERRIAFEVETGASDAVSNVRKCLEAGFERVYCLPTSHTAMKKISRELEKAGLAGDKRVKLKHVKKMF